MVHCLISSSTPVPFSPDIYINGANLRNLKLFLILFSISFKFKFLLLIISVLLTAIIRPSVELVKVLII
ncbi:MAG: hypothetical protein CM1200mP33_5930 [Chloroflexota bacterium]|nr:MAG: hypothetical protein CM1200mP33_5930 [Chloroflexota bacterium]